MSRTLLALLIICLTTGCGVSAQNEPVLITSTHSAEPTPTITIKSTVAPATTSSSPTPATSAARDSQER
ncbi:hypothetical protein SAMN04488074_14310 [Lentzea albidocapillata subsp. violacea]|uniref:Uncharacterized protein n=1 Tax=Lentzea albidocapillata subsp. violacea TaxID=128104 RepID=A0A1H0A1J6_9PSEU|nr:hypothetical protein SAMN04488074_14310 [Lentzea albidocapillata subsp. violacea]